MPRYSRKRGKEQHIYLTDGTANVLAANEDVPQMTIHSFGKGYGVYLSDFKVSPESTRMLLDILLLGIQKKQEIKYLSDSPYVDVAYFPNDRTLIAASVGSEEINTKIVTDKGVVEMTLQPHEMKAFILE